MEERTFVNGNGTADLMKNLPDSINTLLFMVEAFDDFIKRFPFIIESLNEEIIKYRKVLREDGKFIKTVNDLVSLLASDEFNSLINAIYSSFKEVKENNYRTSITGVMRALTDEDIQRALAFVFLVLKKFGESLKK